MRSLPILLLLIAMPVMAATVWKWRDANGVVHYSDQPVPGAEQLTVDRGNQFTPASGSSASSASSVAAAAKLSYQIQITQPQAEATLTGTGGSVTVALAVQPGLPAGFQTVVYLDGKKVQSGSQALSVALNEVERGAHSVTAAVLDAQGQTVATSSPVTFHVFQPTALRPR